MRCDKFLIRTSDSSESTRIQCGFEFIIRFGNTFLTSDVKHNSIVNMCGAQIERSDWEQYPKLGTDNNFSYLRTAETESSTN